MPVADSLLDPLPLSDMHEHRSICKKRKCGLGGKDSNNGARIFFCTGHSVLFFKKFMHETGVKSFRVIGGICLCVCGLWTVYVSVSVSVSVDCRRLSVVFVLFTPSPLPPGTLHSSSDLQEPELCPVVLICQRYLALRLFCPVVNKTREQQVAVLLD
ncbi:hypothetical protein FIM1_863 [Kluyveromyces marxianus]|uniref:Uncharacterized protein n=1 Tax=Kluyveromyces marxianus TaxID=4911 RepID=A0ABX6EQG2_KLUMA|nr:hypothetical protein FIM1_863 [Kluyveromyces marxianus]